MLSPAKLLRNFPWCKLCGRTVHCGISRICPFTTSQSGSFWTISSKPTEQLKKMVAKLYCSGLNNKTWEKGLQRACLRPCTCCFSMKLKIIRKICFILFVQKPFLAILWCFFHCLVCEIRQINFAKVWPRKCFCSEIVLLEPPPRPPSKSIDGPSPSLIRITLLIEGVLIVRAYNIFTTDYYDILLNFLKR